MLFLEMKEKMGRNDRDCKRNKEIGSGSYQKRNKEMSDKGKWIMGALTDLEGLSK